MRSPVTAQRQRLVRRSGVVAALLILPVVAGCGDDGEEDSTFPCAGMVERDILVEVLGTEIEQPEGFVGDPPDESSFCDVRSVDQPEETSMAIHARTPSEAEVADMSRDWPETAADAPCRHPSRDPWVAPREGERGYACTRYRGGVDTVLSSLWGDLYVEVRISRPRARPGDAENAYRLAGDVADHLNA